MQVTRLEANRAIIAVLTDRAERHPDMRFNQLLSSLSLMPRSISYDEKMSDLMKRLGLDPRMFEDRIDKSTLFYEESAATLERIQKEASKK